MTDLNTCKENTFLSSYAPTGQFFKLNECLFQSFFSFLLFLLKDIHKDNYIARMNHIVRQRQHTQYSECTSHTNEPYTKPYQYDD